MDYQQTVQYLFDSAPLFQNVGAGAYKEGLFNTYTLDEHLGHPHTKYYTIHVAGTNGKGSCSHTIAAILQDAGYKVGLYTSPHLIDFRERIRVNGKCVSEEYVVNWVAQHREFFEPLHPSFFELATAMAFNYFADEKVDVAVIEVGLGGRLDCTNIISPVLSIITNISFDHVQFLGDTLAKIASEKAGIIKYKTSVVIGETTEETRPVFEAKAREESAEAIFSEDFKSIVSSQPDYTFGGTIYHFPNGATMYGQLGGICQEKNTNTILNAVQALKRVFTITEDEKILPAFNITDSNVRNGFAHVCEMTGLMGRWQRLGEAPLRICDTGHNIGGFQYITKQILYQYSNRLATDPEAKLRIVFGMVNDKDISGVLKLMPKEATYYFTNASVKRALPAEDVARLSSEYGLHGSTYPTVIDAYNTAIADSSPSDFIYIGGSSFIVADLLAALQ